MPKFAQAQSYGLLKSRLDLDAPRNQAEPLLHENQILLATDEHG